MKEIQDAFAISPDGIRGLIADFHREMRLGLDGAESSLKMIPSFVVRPQGSEKGRFLALDLGGTNMRVLAVELDGRGGCSIAAVDKYAIRHELMTGDGESLFNFIAGCVGKFLHNAGIGSDDCINLGFTFSFPVDQTAVAAGRLIRWTKGFTASGVEGEDIVAIMQKSFERMGTGHVRIAALVNDTVGTLAAKSYSERSCDTGVILGTGTNACYCEDTANIGKLKRSGEGEMIVNMEWGNFAILKRGPIDLALDEESENPGAQYFEKMVSGMYLGELTRRVVCEMARSGAAFRSIDRDVIFKKGSFRTEHMSAIAGGDFGVLSDLGLLKATREDREFLTSTCGIVSSRSARLAGAAIAAVVSWMDQGLDRVHTIGVDGSLFEKYPGYRDIMETVLDDLFGVKAGRIKLEMAKDGSGEGAAVIAATMANHGEP